MKKKIIFYSIIYFSILFILRFPFWQSLDTSIALNIIDSRTPAATTFFDIFTKLASTKVILVLIAIISIIFYRKSKLLIIQFVSTFVMSSGLVFVLKNIIQRARPAFSQLHIETSFSFPSGHSNAIATLCGFGILVVWKYMKSMPLRILTTLALLTVVVLVGYSRLYLSVHWFTDVLAGFSTATYALCVMNVLFTNYNKQQKNISTR